MKDRDIVAHAHERADKAERHVRADACHVDQVLADAQADDRAARDRRVARDRPEQDACDAHDPAAERSAADHLRDAGRREAGLEVLKVGHGQSDRDDDARGHAGEHGA